MFPLVSITLFLPLVGAMLLVLMRGSPPRLAHTVGIEASGITLLGSLLIWARGTPGEGFSKASWWACITDRTTSSRADRRSRNVTPERSTTTGLPNAQTWSSASRRSGREYASNSPRMPTFTPAPWSTASMPCKVSPLGRFPDATLRPAGAAKSYAKAWKSWGVRARFGGPGLLRYRAMGPRAGLPVSERPPRGSE